jgi:membrane-bound serine protease (ClpP class)
MNPYILLILGFLLIFIEFYIPGAIMGTLGGILTFASIIMFVSENDSWIAIISYIAAVMIGLGLLFKFALWRIRTAKPGSSIYSGSSQDGYKASRFDHTAIGKTGVVLSDLKPGGYILIDNKQLQAISESGYIVKGSKVVVISGQEESLIVKQITLKDNDE